MSRTQAAASKPSSVSRALARDRLGVPAVLSFVLASVAPLTVAAGVIPTAYQTTGLTGIPAAFLVMAVILAIFAAGYVAMTRISAVSRTPRMRPVTSTRSRPRTVITAHAASAHRHHGWCMPRWAAAWLAAAGPSAPYSPTCKNEYASSATRAAATPRTRPVPREMNA